MNYQEDWSITAGDASTCFVGGALDWQRPYRAEQEQWDQLATLLGIKPLGDGDHAGIAVQGTQGYYNFIEILLRTATMRQRPAVGDDTKVEM